MSGVEPSAVVGLGELARDKLVRILGKSQGDRVFDETLSELGIRSIDDADQLYVFGETIAKRGGFEAAVGRLLGVAAVMRGATGPRR